MCDRCGLRIGWICTWSLAATVLAAEPESLVSTSTESRVVRSALDKPVTLDFQETPFEDVVEFIHDFTGINVILEDRGIKAASIAREVPVTLSLDNVPLHAALDLLLDQLDLTYFARGDILCITHPEFADEPEIRVYPVLDLIHAGSTNGPVIWLDTEYIRLITDTVDPESWETSGGRGAISFAPASASFVILASPATHRKVADLLTQLRTSRKLTQELAETAKIASFENQLVAIANDIRARPAIKPTEVQPTLKKARAIAEAEAAATRAKAATVELELQNEKLKQLREASAERENQRPQ